MKKINIAMLTIMVLALAIGCGPKVTTMKSTDKDLDNYKSYAYLPNSNFEMPNEMEANIDDVGKAVIEEMNRNMKRAGYELNRDDPDLLVILNTNLKPDGMTAVPANYATYPYKTKNPVSPYYKPYYYWGYEKFNDIADYTIDVGSHFDGALEIDLVDRKTRNIVWSGKAKAPIYNNDTSEALASYLDSIFDNYPTIAQN